MHTNEELEKLSQMPLADKITMSKLRIVEFYEHYDGNVVVSFSGGKDSTVLLHLVRSLFPNVKGVYCNTGLEFPEVKDHVKSMKNIDIIHPEISFLQVIEQYGWVYPWKKYIMQKKEDHGRNVIWLVKKRMVHRLSSKQGISAGSS